MRFMLFVLAGAIGATQPCLAKEVSPLKEKACITQYELHRLYPDRPTTLSLLLPPERPNGDLHTLLINCTTNELLRVQLSKHENKPHWGQNFNDRNFMATVAGESETFILFNFNDMRTFPGGGCLYDILVTLKGEKSTRIEKDGVNMCKANTLALVQLPIGFKETKPGEIGATEAFRPGQEGPL